MSPSEMSGFKQWLARKREVLALRARVAELEAQIEHQKVGSFEAEKAMQKQDARIGQLERENRRLSGL